MKQKLNHSEEDEEEEKEEAGEENKSCLFEEN